MIREVNCYGLSKLAQRDAGQVGGGTQVASTATTTLLRHSEAFSVLV